MSGEKHYGYFDGHRLRANTFAMEVKSFDANTPLEFTVKPARGQKSNPQNKYLHKLFDIIAKAINEGGFGDGKAWTKETVKFYAKQAELYPIEDRILPGGEVVRVALDTHELDKYQMMQTIDRVLLHFEEMGMRLPRPNEQMEIAA